MILPRALIAVVVLAVGGSPAVAEGPVRVERTLDLVYQPLSSLELNGTRTSVVAVNTHGDVGVIDDAGRATRFRRTHVSQAVSATFSPDDKLVFVGRSDGRITVLDSQTLREQATIPCFEGTCAQLRSAGRVLFALDLRKTGKLFLVREKGKLEHILTIQDVITTSPVPRPVPLRILLANGLLHSYDPDSLVLTSQGTGLRDVPADIRIDQISPDGEYAYGSSRTGLARMSLRERDPKWESFDEHTHAFSSFDYVGDTGLIVAAQTTIAYVDRRTRKTLSWFEMEKDTVHIVRSLSKPGSFVAALNDGTVVFFSIPLPK